MWVDPKAPAADPRHPSQAGRKLGPALESTPPADGPPATDPEPAPPKARRKSTRKPADLKTALAKLDKTKGPAT